MQQYLHHTIPYIQLCPAIQKHIPLTNFLKQLNLFVKSKSFIELIHLAGFIMCYFDIQLIFIG